MKKLFLGVVFVGALCTFSSCNKVKEAKDAVNKAKEAVEQAAEKAKPIDVNYRMFEDEAETKKVYDEIVAKLGEEAKIADKIRVSISRPSVEGTIKRAGDPDSYSITIDTQDPTNPKRIRETRFWSDRGWQPSQQMEVNVIGGNKESFRLENELFDFNNITFDIFKKVLADAYAKHKDTEKYEYQYIQGFTIDKKGFDVTIYGKLAANEQQKNNYYRADLTGKARR